MEPVWVCRLTLTLTLYLTWQGGEAEDKVPWNPTRCDGGAQMEGSQEQARWTLTLTPNHDRNPQP